MSRKVKITGEEKAEIAKRRAEITAASSPEEQMASLRKQIRLTLDTLNGAKSMETRNEAVKQLISKCVFDKATMRLSVVYRFSF